MKSFFFTLFAVISFAASTAFAQNTPAPAPADPLLVPGLSILVENPPSELKANFPAYTVTAPPAVPRIKIFTGATTDSGARNIEEKFGKWLAENKGIRVTEKSITSGDGKIILLISYEGFPPAATEPSK